MNKNICFFANHPGGANALVPVIDKVQRQHRMNVQVFGFGAGARIFSSCFGLIHDMTNHNISVDAMKAILLDWNAAVVVTGCGAQEGAPNDIIEQTAVLAARALGIPSLSVMDSWQGYEKCFTDIRTGKYLDCLPTRIAIMDEVARADMEKRGFSDDILVSTGNPYYDSLARRATQFTQQKRQEIRQLVGLSNQRIFFFAPNVFSKFEAVAGFWTLDTLRIICEVLPEIPDVGVVVQLHPAIEERAPGDKEKLVAMISVSGGNIKLVQGFASLDLALAADVTIVESSNMGLEGVYMRRPVISLQPGQKGPDDLFVSRAGIIPVGYTEATCKSLLRATVSPDYCRALLEQSEHFSNDGKATDRVVELVHSLL